MPYLQYVYKYIYLLYQWKEWASRNKSNITVLALWSLLWLCGSYELPVITSRKRYEQIVWLPAGVQVAPLSLTDATCNCLYDKLYFKLYM